MQIRPQPLLALPGVRSNHSACSEPAFRAPSRSPLSRRSVRVPLGQRESYAATDPERKSTVVAGTAAASGTGTALRQAVSEWTMAFLHPAGRRRTARPLSYRFWQLIIGVLVLVVVVVSVGRLAQRGPSRMSAALLVIGGAVVCLAVLGVLLSRSSDSGRAAPEPAPALEPSVGQARQISTGSRRSRSRSRSATAIPTVSGAWAITVPHGSMTMLRPKQRPARIVIADLAGRERRNTGSRSPARAAAPPSGPGRCAVMNAAGTTAPAPHPATASRRYSSGKRRS